MQLEPKLREAGIDLDVLGELEHADLVEIGLSLGDRKRLLKALRSLSATSSATAPTPTSVLEFQVPYARQSKHEAGIATMAVGVDTEHAFWPKQFGWWLNVRQGILRKLGLSKF